MRRILILVFVFVYTIMSGQSDKDDLISKYADSACECIEEIKLKSKSKIETNSEINVCINDQILMYQMTSKISDTTGLIDILEKSATDIENDSIKGNNIIINIGEESDDYKAYYYELERYLMSNCEAARIAVASDGQESPVSISNQKLAQKYYNKGYNEYQKQNFKKAIVFYKKAVKEDPKFAFAWDNLGLSYRNQGDYKKAINAYEKSLELDPYGTMPLQNIAVAYRYEKEFEKAISAYEKLGTLYKENPEVYYGIGNIYAFDLKNYKDALINICKAYTLYVETNSPYRTDAEKVITFIYDEMSKKGEEEIFNKILLENNISTYK